MATRDKPRFNPKMDDPNKPRGWCQYFDCGCRLDPKTALIPPKPGVDRRFRRFKCIGSNICEEWRMRQ